VKSTSGTQRVVAALRWMAQAERDCKDLVKRRLGWPPPEDDPVELPMTLYGDRAIEYGLLFRHLGPGQGRLLDVGGGAASAVATIAAGLGWKVTSLDLFPSPLEFADAEFVRADFTRWDCGDQLFDRIVFLSSLEHFGLSGRYGSPEEEMLDRAAFLRAVEMLAPNGRILLSVPFGQAAVLRPFHRVYDRRGLDGLVSPLHADVAIFYRKGRDGIWRSCPEAEAARVTPSQSFYALAFLRLGRG
jgi:hypothetical protein